MARVIVSREARNDLVSIRDYIRDELCNPETSCQGLFNQIHKKATKKVPGSTFMLLTLRQAGHLRPLNSSSQRYAYSGNWSI